MLTFSAAITTYEREWSLIERAIQSIEQQTYPILEILLVDDNADDSPYTKAILRGLKKHPLVRYLTYPGNRGVSLARNYAIEHARGAIIGFLDDDDEWLVSKIATQIEVFNKQKNAALVFAEGVKYSSVSNSELTWSSRQFKPQPSFEDMLEKDYVGTATKS